MQGSYTRCGKSAGAFKYLEKFTSDQKKQKTRLHYYSKNYPVIAHSIPYPHPRGDRGSNYEIFKMNPRFFLLKIDDAAIVKNTIYRTCQEITRKRRK